MKYIRRKGSRWCTVCNQFERFLFDKVIRHSYCKECANQAGIALISDIKKAIEYQYNLKVDRSFKDFKSNGDEYKLNLKLKRSMDWKVKQYNILYQMEVN